MPLAGEYHEVVDVGGVRYAQRLDEHASDGLGGVGTGDQQTHHDVLVVGPTQQPQCLAGAGAQKVTALGVKDGDTHLHPVAAADDDQPRRLWGGRAPAADAQQGTQARPLLSSAAVTTGRGAVSRIVSPGHGACGRAAPSSSAANEGSKTAQEPRSTTSSNLGASPSEPLVSSVRGPVGVGEELTPAR